MSAELGRFLSFAFANADVLVEVDSRGAVTFATGALQTLLGMADGVIGLPVEELIAPGDRGLVRRLIRTLPPNSRLAPRTVALASGSGAATLCGYRLGRASSVQLTLTRVGGMAATSALAPRDRETGLIEADAFEAQLAERFGLAASGGSPKLSLVRIADFGQIKSSLAPDVLAALLEEVGSLLRLYATDDALAGRLGENRFGIVHAESIAASRIAAEIREAGRALAPDAPTLTVQNTTLDLTAPGLSREDAGRVLVFAVRHFAENDASVDLSSMSDALHMMVDQTVGRVASLRSTINGRGVSLQFQAIVDSRTSALHHYEALARFPDGAAGPTIAFAESIGLVQEVDLLVAQKAIDLLNAQRKNPDLKLAVNMSAASLESDIFLAAYRKLFARSPELRPRVFIEVTESHTITDLARAARVLAELRQGGQPICLDDFGAGAASFPYLQALPIDYVKVDGSYIKRLGRSTRDDAILKGMVGLCRDIGVKVIAEMVETADQAVQVAALGIALSQGYHFARPSDMPDYEPISRPQPGGASRRRGAQETWG